ncbi:DUF4232 domain-containing protein [Nocardia sp. NPDC052566]|uniref:DUF4232 domain-containing protein n=1 Tax=Nocardia sp. NPDC052566 TaxID=3364330 RepID=UPI0037C6EFFF
MFRTAYATAALVAATLSLPAATATATADENVGRSDACIAANTTVAVQNAARPINHLILGVTNIGGSPCTAYYYPRLRFDEAQSAAPAIEDSRPQALVTINPGETAYAGIITSAADNPDVIPARRLGVAFAESDNNTYDGDSVTVDLPAGTTVGAATVTYWQRDANSALTY